MGSQFNGGGVKILSVGGVVIQWPPVSGGRNSTWKIRWILIAARWIKTPRVEIQWGQNSILHRLSLKFYRNNVYGHLEQVSRTCVYFHFQITQLVLQTCSKCPYTLFLWKFNDSSLCIGNERYICTTIWKHTINSGLCIIFGKIPRYFWLNFQVLASICYLLVNSLLCSDSVKAGQLVWCIKCH